MLLFRVVKLLQFGVQLSQSMTMAVTGFWIKGVLEFSIGHN